MEWPQTELTVTSAKQRSTLAVSGTVSLGHGIAHAKGLDVRDVVRFVRRFTYSLRNLEMLKDHQHFMFASFCIHLVEECLLGQAT